MHQPLFGAIFPVIIATICFLARGRRASLTLLIMTPLAMLACAFWAVMPDLPKLIGNMDIYYRLQASPWINLFFLHGWIDAIEGTWFDAYTPLFNALFTAITALPMLVAWHELALRERHRT